MLNAWLHVRVINFRIIIIIIIIINVGYTPSPMTRCQICVTRRPI